MKKQKFKSVGNLLKIYIIVIALLSISCINTFKAPPAVIIDPYKGKENIDYFDTLKWTFYNNDYDNYTVDLYFDTVSEPTLVKENIQDNFYKFECMPNKTYYWGFILKDKKGNIISNQGPSGQIFTEYTGSFKTLNYPMNPTPANGATIHYKDTLKWDCAEFSCGNYYSLELYHGNEPIFTGLFCENKYYIFDSLNTGTYNLKVTVLGYGKLVQASNSWTFNFSNGK